MTGRLRTTLLFLIVFGVSAAIRLPLSLRYTRLTPDAIAYYNIARNLADVHGFTSSLRLHYQGNSPVVHPAISDWPPAYPLFAGLIVRCGGDVRTLQFANALLISISVGLIFLVGCRLFDWRAGLIAGLASAIAPNLSRASALALSDPLSLALALSAILIYLSDRRLMSSLAVGLLCALATLTRYPCAVVPVSIIVASVLSGKSRRYAVVCAGAFVCLVGPVVAWQAIVSGSPQAQAIHYYVRSYHEAMWSARAQIDPLYALHHPMTVMTEAARNCAFYAIDLLVGLRGLFLLALGLLFLKRNELSPDKRLVLTVAALSFCVYAVTWSIPAVRGSRFMLLSYCLLLPFCAAGFWLNLKSAGWRRRSAMALCAATACVYVWGTLSAYEFRGQEFALSAPTTAAIVRDLPTGTCIASNNPWVVSYSTRMPTGLLPRDMDQSHLARFVRDLNVGEVVLIGQHPRFQTARVLRGCYRNVMITRTVHMATVPRPIYGQNAYEGTWKMMPQIVQKLPSTHSPSMIPRKNGNALR